MAVYAVQAPGSRKVLRNVSETLAVTFYDEEAEAIPDDVTVTVRDTAGATVFGPVAAAHVGTQWTTTLPAQADLANLEASWLANFGAASSTFITTHSVVGGLYATPAEVRALDALSDPQAYPTDRIHEAIDWAEQVIEDVTGASFVRRAGRLVFSGSATGGIHLGVIYPSRLLSVKEDGVEVSTTGWGLSDEGYLTRSTGVFPLPTTAEPNVVVTFEYGVSESPPPDVRWAARTLARQYLVDLVSRVPDRALSMVNEFGQVNLAQAGTGARPTSLPEVNAVLNRHRHAPPAAF